MAGPRPVPEWLEGLKVEVHRSAPATPAIHSASAATAYHEVIEALRWARELVATGEARPEEIAIAAAAPSAYDDEFIALRSDANLDVHFVHGVRVVNTREGQAAAALADILVRGISQTRLRRLVTLVSGQPGAFGKLPEGWLRILPYDAPLATPEAWDRFFSSLAPEDYRHRLSSRAEGLLFPWIHLPLDHLRARTSMVGIRPAEGGTQQRRGPERG